MIVNWYILAGIMAYELILWGAWLTKDGFFEAPHFQPYGFKEAIQYTYFRFRWSFNTEAKTMGMIATLARQSKHKRESNGAKKQKS